MQVEHVTISVKKGNTMKSYEMSQLEYLTNEIIKWAETANTGRDENGNPHGLGFVALAKEIAEEIKPDSRPYSYDGLTVVDAEDYIGSCVDVVR
jgi:hypothetical protein